MPNYAFEPCCLDVCAKVLHTWNLSFLHDNVQVEWKPSVICHRCLILDIRVWGVVYMFTSWTLVIKCIEGKISLMQVQVVGLNTNYVSRFDMHLICPHWNILHLWWHTCFLYIRLHLILSHVIQAPLIVNDKTLLQFQLALEWFFCKCFEFFL